MTNSANIFRERFENSLNWEFDDQVDQSNQNREVLHRLLGETPHEVEVVSESDTNESWKVHFQDGSWMRVCCPHHTSYNTPLSWYTE